MSDKMEKIEWLKPEITFTYGMVGGEEFFRIHKTNLEVLFVANHHHSKKGDYGKRWHECVTIEGAKAKAEELLEEWNQRADLAKPSEWISVADDLPEYDSVVILFRCGDWGETICFGERKSRGSMLADFYLEHQGSFKMPQHDITHWQPLPSPPTRETP